MDLRRNVRARLHMRVTVSGTDAQGRPFEIQGRSLDFSRKGLGLMLDGNGLSPGAVVSLRAPGHVESGAVVQWIHPGPSAGSTRAGLRLINPRASLPFRIAASILLCLALLGQVSLARSRSYARAAEARSCVMNLAQMKGILEQALSRYAVVSDTDKAFVHILHQHMTCEQYTQTYEKSSFYPDPKTRAAIANWHWTVYHAQDKAVRATAIQSVEGSLNGAQ